MIYVKVHKDVVALCDEDIIGKTFEDSKRKLEVSERFYRGDLLDEEKVIGVLKKSKNLNLVGNNVVKIALDNGIISKEEVIKIGEVNHAQIYTVD